MRRGGANGWILLGLGVILVSVMFEVGRSWLFGAPPSPLPERVEEPAEPAFHVGDLAPDFILPDRDERPHRLSELVHGDTLLFLACGCDACRELQIYTGILEKRMGAKAPAVLTVTTMPKEQQDAWVRDTGLQQTFLYERKRGPIMAQYAGHPCPRAYRLNAERKVVWISPSLTRTHFIEKVGNTLAVELGFKAERQVPGE